MDGLKFILLEHLFLALELLCFITLQVVCITVAHLYGALLQFRAFSCKTLLKTHFDLLKLWCSAIYLSLGSIALGILHQLEGQHLPDREMWFSEPLVD